MFLLATSSYANTDSFCGHFFEDANSKLVLPYYVSLFFFFLSKFQLQIDKRIRSTSRIILLLNNGCHTLEQNDLAMLKIFEDKSMVDELL